MDICVLKGAEFSPCLRAVTFVFSTLMCNFISLFRADLSPLRFSL